MSSAWVLATFLLGGVSTVSLVLFGVESGRNVALVKTAKRYITDQNKKLKGAENRIQQLDELGKSQMWLDHKSSELAAIDREILALRTHHEANLQQVRRTVKFKMRDKAVQKVKEEFEPKFAELDKRRLAAAQQVTALREKVIALRTSLDRKPAENDHAEETNDVDEKK